MPNRPIDTSVAYSTIDYAALPDSQRIEDPEQDTIAERDPVTKLVRREPYLASPALMEAVDLAIALGRPLLLQGEPGCGKTRLAYAVAYALGLPLEVSYIKSTTRAQDLLYTYDAISRLYDAQLPAADQAPSFFSRRPRSGLANIRQYIRLGPLGRAIARAQYGRRSVVLIDEIDKADLDFPNDLLWELDRLEFRVTEAPEMRFAAGEDPKLRPIVFVTHNEEKALPTAFLRRCIYHYIDFPPEEQLLAILKTQQLTDQAIHRRAVHILLRLRGLGLNKPPGLSELLDWVGYLEAVDLPEAGLDKLPYLGMLLKHEADQRRARQEAGAG